MTVGINWRLFSAVALVAVGLSLIVGYNEDPRLTPLEKEYYQRRRQFGYALLVAGVFAGAYFYYQGYITFRAEMPGECGRCSNYIARSKAVRPFRPEEYSQLKSQAAACKKCSDMCFDEINLIQKTAPERTELLKRKKDACATVTKHAMLARKELERLGGRLKDRQVAMWQGAHDAGAEPVWDPFPGV